jgi:hypothetical protein
MKCKLALGFAVASLLLTSTVFAAEFVSSKDGQLNLPASDKHHNVYVAGHEINVASNVTGDLTAAGDKINVTGTIEHNLDAAGNHITTSNSIGGTVKAAGQNITIGGNVGGDVVAAGANVQINGTVTGDVVVAAKSLTFGPQAVVTGHVTYYGRNDAKIEDGAKVPAIDNHKVQFGDLGHAKKALHVFGTLVSTLAWILAAGVLVWLFPKHLQALIRLVSQKPWKNLGVGLLGLIIPPIAFVLLFIILVGYYVAFASMFLWLFLLSLSCIVAAIWLGARLLSWFRKTEPKADYLAAIIGVLALKLLMFIPILGWLAGGLIILAAFGSILRYAYADIKNNR